ncbi:Uncharacterized protein SCF082_LOCUS22677, partial [Durusdinium trenchii]
DCRDESGVSRGLVLRCSLPSRREDPWSGGSRLRDPLHPTALGDDIGKLAAPPLRPPRHGVAFASVRGDLHWRPNFRGLGACEEDPQGDERRGRRRLGEELGEGRTSRGRARGIKGSRRRAGSGWHSRPCGQRRKKRRRQEKGEESQPGQEVQEEEEGEGIQEEAKASIKEPVPGRREGQGVKGGQGEEGVIVDRLQQSLSATQWEATPGGGDQEPGGALCRHWTRPPREGQAPCHAPSKEGSEKEVQGQVIVQQQELVNGGFTQRPRGHGDGAVRPCATGDRRREHQRRVEAHCIDVPPPAVGPEGQWPGASGASDLSALNRSPVERAASPCMRHIASTHEGNRECAARSALVRGAAPGGHTDRFPGHGRERGDGDRATCGLRGVEST